MSNNHNGQNGFESINNYYRLAGYPTGEFDTSGSLDLNTPVESPAFTFTPDVAGHGNTPTSYQNEIDFSTFQSPNANTPNMNELHASSLGISTPNLSTPNLHFATPNLPNFTTPNLPNLTTPNLPTPNLSTSNLPKNDLNISTVNHQNIRQHNIDISNQSKTSNLNTMNNNRDQIMKMERNSQSQINHMHHVPPMQFNSRLNINQLKRKGLDSEIPQPNAKRKKPSSLKIPQKSNVVMAKKLGSIPIGEPVLQSKPVEEEDISNLEDFDDQEDEDDDSPHRRWVTVSQSTNHNFEWRVRSKTRTDPERVNVPKKMYSSLKYQIKTLIKCSDAVKREFSCLIARCTVVDAEDGFTEITKDGKIILEDTPEVALSSGDEGYSGSLKVRFLDCSYHHSSHDFCWQISFYAPKDLENPLLVIRSGPFRVLARRPKSIKKKNKTPKKSTQQVQPAADDSSPFKIFEKKLEELVASTKYFKEEERKQAMVMVSNRLLQSDPDRFLSRFGQHNQNNGNPR